uniref:Lysozyme g n=1 Tax=Pygocentrus nattereri TaxID=42514 RepID=A0AAR2JSJ6_PYGNA
LQLYSIFWPHLTFKTAAALWSFSAITINVCCCPFLTGVPASHALAEEDADRMKNFKNSIFNVTRAGNVLPSSGWNEGGVAFGIMQVVARCNSPKGGKDSEEHITQAAGILIDFINSMNKSWPPALQYKGGIAAYNCGPGAVTSQDMDQNTEGGDYANDVVARAQWYKHHGY